MNTTNNVRLSPTFLALYSDTVDITKLERSIHDCQEREMSRSETTEVTAKYKGKLTKNRDIRQIAVSIVTKVKQETSKGRMPRPLQVLVHDITQCDQARYNDEYCPLPLLLAEYVTTKFAKSASVTESASEETDQAVNQ